MKISITYEIDDHIRFKAPRGGGKFIVIVGTIQDITQRFDEENDMSQTVFAVNVNETLYNIAYVQILGIAVDDDHHHDYELRCTTCGDWSSNPNE